MGLRCQPYGDLWDCCGCGVGPLGIYGVVAAAVWHLMGILWVLWLRCVTYGDLCGAVAAVGDLLGESTGL